MRGSYSIGRGEERLDPIDEIDKLARRHVAFVFADAKGRKDAPGLELSVKPDSVTGKFTLTVNPPVIKELVRSFGNAMSTEHWMSNNLGAALAHLDDHMEKKAGLTSRDLLKVLRTAEASRLAARQLGNS